MCSHVSLVSVLETACINSFFGISCCAALGGEMRDAWVDKLSDATPRLSLLPSRPSRLFPLSLPHDVCTHVRVLRTFGRFPFASRNYVVIISKSTEGLSRDCPGTHLHRRLVSANGPLASACHHEQPPKQLEPCTA